MRTWASLPAALAMLVAWPAGADPEEEEEVTDMEFLEYLGSWDESDEEWLLFDEPEVASRDKADEQEQPEEVDEDDG